MKKSQAIQELIDAAFSVMLHDVSRDGGDEAKQAYDNLSEALRKRFVKILRQLKTRKET